jgi:mono/diheme cytochrome c family protein
VPASCPDPTFWRGLLDGTLPPTDEKQLHVHLDSCLHCQQVLQDLAAGSDSWAGLPRYFGEGMASPEDALRRIMEKMGGRPQPAQTVIEPRPAERDSLDFLDPTDEPGQLGRLGPYQVLEVIGRGGMGVVFRAFDPKLERFVAIKVMAPQLAAQESARKRFLREARAAAQITHEHVITIHAVDESRGLPYIVMQYVAGGSLEERLAREGPLPLPELLRIGIQTASGLAAAHARGLVHRDVKPANILLEDGVKVKLTDFGLARAVDDGSISQSGVIAGTPQYMAPEQARGEAVDHRADLFSLGSLLYAAGTGQPPFPAGNPLAVLRRVSDETRPPVNEVNPALPRWLASIVARLQAKGPAARFQTATEIADLLERHLRQLQRPMFAAPAPAPAAVPVAVEPPSPRKTPRWKWGIAAAVACLLIGLAVAGTLFVPSLLSNRAPEKQTVEDGSGSVAPAGESADGADAETLARQTQQILTTNCHRCHGENGAVEGGFNYLLDRDRLVARKKIVPGQPEKSHLLQRIQDGEMPPEDEKPRPTAEDIARLRRWIAAGAPAFAPSAASSSFITPAEVVRAIEADLLQHEERERRFFRYFTLTHLYNAGLSADEMQTYRNGLAKLINSLSWRKNIVVPVPVDPNRTILRINLRDYGWTEDLWDVLVAKYPYRADGDFAALPLRGDWFVATASRPPLYHELLQLPGNERELEKQVHIKVEDDIRNESVARAGFSDSGVSHNNRLIERHETPYGAYWKSYDFAENVGAQNLFDRPLGPGSDNRSFRHAGGEIIFNLPNALQGYMLVNGKGERIDKGPTDIVSDPKRPDRAVENGLSCMSCHSHGINPKTDQIRAHVQANASAFAKEERETILKLYPPAEDFRELIRQDTERFEKAAAATGAKVGATEPIRALAAQFESPLDLRRAAAEVGLTPADFLANLEQSPEIGRAIGALKLPGGTVQRQTFVRVFPEMVSEWKLSSTSVASQLEGKEYPLGEGHPFPPYLVGTDAGESLKDGFRLKPEHYIHTKEGNLLPRDFVFELTFDIDRGEGIMVVGIGDQYRPLNGPSRISWRIHPPHLAGGYVAFGKSGATEEEIGRITQTGTYLLRLEKKDKALLFSIGTKSKDHFETVVTRTTPDVRSFAPFLNEHNAFIYVGNAGKLKQVRLTEGTASHEKPEISLPAVEEPVPTAPPAVPAPKLDGRVEVKLPEPFAQVRTGGGGRYLIFHLKKAQKLALFDVSQVKIVHEIEVPDDVVYAAGRDKLMVVVPDQKLIQRWDLRTGRREKTAPAPDGVVVSALMGCNGTGPLLLFVGGKFVGWDVERMAPIADMDDKGLGGDMRWDFQARISADGQTLTVWHGGISGQQYGLVHLRKPNNKVSRSPDAHSFNGHWAMPSADGSLVFRFGAGIYDGDDMQILAADRFKGAVLVPTEDPRFFLAVREETRDTNTVAICASSDRVPVFTLRGVEKMTGSSLNSNWVRVNNEPRIHYLSSANVLVNLPESNDRVVLRPLNLMEELKRSGQDYLFVLSRPDKHVAAGKLFTYRMDIRSKESIAGCRLESGPEGLTVFNSGTVRWSAPARPDRHPARVIITIQSASCKEFQHSFDLVVE